jgi:hypothetical protein
LAPALYSDVDSFFRPVFDVQSPPQHGSTQHVRCGPVTDADIIYAASIVSGRLQPGLVADSDTIFAAATAASNTLRPALAPDSEAIYAPGVVNIRLGLGPATVPADDAVFAFTTTQIVQPSRVADADAIPAADVGWRLFANAPVVDTDQVFDASLHFYNVIAADILVEDDVLDTYPFYVHRLEGGTPIAEPEHLTGSVHPKSPVLTGSLSNPRRVLTGSVGKTNRRMLTGSVRGITYTNRR